MGFANQGGITINNTILIGQNALSAPLVFNQTVNNSARPLLIDRSGLIGSIKQQGITGAIQYSNGLYATENAGLKYNGSDSLSVNDQSIKGILQSQNVLFGSSSTFTVPINITTITARLWGAGGGTTDGKLAGGGGYINKTIPVSTGQTYVVTVGQVGQSTLTGPAPGGGQGSGNGAGGDGSPFEGGGAANVGGGGQYTAIHLFDGSQYTLIACAGGGGGASPSGDGGPAIAVGSGIGYNLIVADLSSAGGTGGDGIPPDGGGGGGGGYGGGTGGGIGNPTSGGQGGGGYLGTTGPTDISDGGNGSTVGGVEDANYPGNVGNGSQNGYAIISYPIGGKIMLVNSNLTISPTGLSSFRTYNKNIDTNPFSARALVIDSLGNIGTNSTGAINGYTDTLLILTGNFSGAGGPLDPSTFSGSSVFTGYNISTFISGTTFQPGQYLISYDVAVNAFTGDYYVNVLSSKQGNIAISGSECHGFHVDENMVNLTKTFFYQISPPDPDTLTINGFGLTSAPLTNGVIKNLGSTITIKRLGN